MEEYTPTEPETGEPVSTEPEAATHGSAPTAGNRRRASVPPPAAGSSSPGGDAPRPAWWDAIDKADVKELAKHSRIAGIAGSIAERKVLEREQVLRAEHAKALADHEANLTAGIKPHLDQHIAKQIEKSRAESLDYHARLVGQQLGELAADMDPAERQQCITDLANDLAGKDDAAAIGHTIRFIAKTIAAKEIKRYKSEELEEQRKAIRNEEAAKLMQKTKAPDTTPPKGPAGKPNIAGMTTAEFDQLSPPNESMGDAIKRLHG